MNQIEIPHSLLTLFVTADRLKPRALLDVVADRYELCEDMACMLTEHTQTMLSNLSLTEEESDSVIRRLAELLAWAPPEFGEVDSSSPRRAV